MKKTLLILVAVAIFIGISLPVFAEETGRGNYSVPSNQYIENYLNETEDFSHTHNYEVEKKRNKVGAGMDLVVYENRDSVLETVEVQGRFNYIDKTSETYLVAKVNLFRLLKQKLNK